MINSIAMHSQKKKNWHPHQNWALLQRERASQVRINKRSYGLGSICNLNLQRNSEHYYY